METQKISIDGVELDIQTSVPETLEDSRILAAEDIIRRCAVVPVGNFNVSYMIQEPLFDGSDIMQDYFCIDIYENYVKLESRRIPKSSLDDPESKS